MKEYTLVLLLLLPVHFFAQCGESGDTLLVESPEALSALAGCTTISGSLLISDPDFIHLDDLLGLESVEEHLIIDGNISLQSLAGLAELVSVGGNLELKSNFTLQSSAGLGLLESVGGDFILDGNITLISTNGFESLTSIGGDVIFRDNHTLEDVQCFASFSSLPGDLILDYENFILNDLDGLMSMEEIQGDVLIELPALTGVGESFASLHTVGGDFYLRDIPLLGTLNGMEELQFIGGDLKLENNDSMVSMNGLAGLDEISGSALLENNNALLLCCVLENWELGSVVQGDIVLSSNHPTCNNLESVLENCEPLSVSELEDDFIPGYYSIASFDLSGRVLSESTRFLSSPNELQITPSTGVVVVHAFHVATGTMLPALVLGGSRP